MSLESTMICLDNSEWMRNGDYIPTRMEAQHDAANLVCGTKTQSNPENTVGVLTMAGKGPELLVSPTEDMGKILSSLHEVPVKGKQRFCSAVQVAQLALKHRRNKHGGQRIIVFCASPIEDEVKQLVKVGKLLKKNNVAADVISMGEIEDNAEKLQAFVDAANSADNCHFVTIPAGILPSDVLISSPIISGGDGGGIPASAGGGGEFGEFGGVDASLDPELAMALRVSMEEERARQEASSKVEGEAKAGESGGADEMEVEAPSTPAPAPAAAAATTDGSAAMDDEALLRQALAMSMSDASGAGSNAPEAAGSGVPEGMDKEEYEAMQAALQMSLAESSSPAMPQVTPTPASTPAQPPKPPKEGGDAAAAASATGGDFLDPSFVSQLLGQLPGVDPNDPRIKEAMKKAEKDGGEKKDGDGDKK
ncbi:unnamed protein product [Chrysoparadoxa australica]